MPQGQDTYVDPPEVSPASPHVDPPSPAANPSNPAANPPSPAKASDKPASPNKATDDVVITGFGHTSPGNPVALSKHSAKVESAAEEKGKWKTDLSSYAHLNAQDLHSGYLNRLYTSRDYEAGLVNMMKERYEVTSKHCKFSCTVYQLHCSPQGSVCLFKMNRDFEIKKNSNL